VRADGKPVVENHSAYLTKNKARSILIQGNTDERGGSEYNLALGQKRAEAVRKAMTTLGVPESQIEAVSLGKEKPKATGSNEEAWAQNRRADIVYK
jgi:peptidoglycan-associated lipoprotein